MLLLTFEIAGAAYAVDGDRVIEVVPRVVPRVLPHAPASLAGVIRYRGEVLPLIDLGRLLGVETPDDRLSTRIVIVRTDDPEAPHAALLAERVGNVRRVDLDGKAAAWLPPAPDGAPYLGPVVEIEGSLVQILKAESIVDQAARAAAQEAP